MEKGKIPTDGDRGEYEIGRLKHQIRIMAMVDLAQSCLLVGLVIHKLSRLGRGRVLPVAGVRTGAVPSMTACTASGP